MLVLVAWFFIWYLFMAELLLFWVCIKCCTVNVKRRGSRTMFAFAGSVFWRVRGEIERDTKRVGYRKMCVVYINVNDGPQVWIGIAKAQCLSILPSLWGFSDREWNETEKWELLGFWLNLGQWVPFFELKLNSSTSQWLLFFFISSNAVQSLIRNSKGNLRNRGH